MRLANEILTNATLGSQIPIPSLTLAARPLRNTWFAPTLTGDVITLLSNGRYIALARLTPLTGSIPVVIFLAAIAFVADDILFAYTFPCKAVTFGRAQRVAYALLAVLRIHRVAVKTRRTQGACRPKGVVQALQAFASNRITRTYIISVNVTRALAGFAVVALHLRTSIISR